MQKKILITGISGFVGRHLSQRLLDLGYEVFGLDRGVPLDLPEACQYLTVDLQDPASMMALPREWFGVIHLAGASIPSLFATTAPVVGNLQITLNLLEHLQAAKVLLVSSCHVYGPSDRLRGEDHPIVPQGRYGLSKHLIEQMALHYEQKLDIRIARPFNHLGPGQRAELVIPSLLHRLATHPKDDLEPVLMHGQNSVRDFIDVRDVVEAYRAILELETPAHKVFNVCTGRACSSGEVVRTILELTGSKRTAQFSNKPNSQDDIPFLVGDCTRLKEASGWVPRMTLADSLSSMLEAGHP